MESRGYFPHLNGGLLNTVENHVKAIIILCMRSTSPIYPEHNENYLMECLTNLRQKGIELVIPPVE